ncbi:unnamed protein product [Blepharisma stoltei]|uniref:4'-phosphopantetheinyl transferase domain-containing protein n=1 Tax=Blepharisma stoltei TaxID=1481888 RepID=A0AAU9JSD2_9CILI|nr:unnamed protein product [Blepharisma stoltei]
MRIIGIGIDLCKNIRMHKILENKNIRERFLEKVLHPNEKIKEINSKYLASRWAIKEALVKATASRRILFHEVEICKQESGQPYIRAYGETKNLLEEIGVENTMMSLSHEDEYSVAVVIAIGN